MKLCWKDEIALPVEFHVVARCLQPKISLLDDKSQSEGCGNTSRKELLVKIPVALQVIADTEGYDDPVVATCTFTVCEVVRLDDSTPETDCVLTAVQRLRVALPIRYSADVDCEVQNVCRN